MLPKRTVLVPNRNFTSSADGHLPRSAVSVAAAPWELEAELNKLGVVQRKASAEPVVRGPDPSTMAGTYYKSKEEIPF